MYLNVSDEFNQIVKSQTITSNAKMVFTNPNITLYGEAQENIKSSIQDIKITDKCFDESKGKLIGTTMCKLAEIKIKNNDNLDLSDKEFALYVGVKLSNEQYEYLPYGNFTIKDYEDIKSNNIFKITAYDYMDKLNIKFDEIYWTKESGKTETPPFNPTFPIKLKDFKKQLLQACNIEYEEQTLANDDFSITVMPNFYGMTVRKIIGHIAELQGTFAKINRNNKMQFYLKTTTTEKIDKFSMNTSLEINKMYGPVNSVALAISNVEGENVTLKDNASIEEYGETMITITDNPFVYSEELREQAIKELFEALKGFSYTPTKFNYKARLYTDCGDIISVENVKTGNYVESMILNQYIEIPATRRSELDNPALSDTAIKNQYISESKQQNTKTEILVNKIDKEITAVVEEIGDRSEKSTTITADIEGLQSTVKNIANVVKEVDNIQNIELNDCMAGNLLNFRIIGDNSTFETLYIDDDVILGDNTFLFGSSIVRVTSTDKDGNTTITDYDLKITEVLRQSGQYYDEVIVEEGKEYLIKRIFFDENGQVIINEQGEKTFIQDIEIRVQEGKNKIEILEYTPRIYLKYIMLNEYTSQFTSTVEFETQIIQLSNELSLIAKEKVGNDEIVAKLNVAVKDEQGIIELIGNVVKIVSDFFELDEQGHIKIKSSGSKFYEYTVDDILLSYLALKKSMTLPDTLLKIYDLYQKDGVISLGDIVIIQNIVSGKFESGTKVDANIEINPDNYNSIIDIKDFGITTVRIGLYKIYSYFINSNVFLAGKFNNNNSLQEGIQGVLINGDKNTIEMYDSSGTVRIKLDGNDGTIISDSLSQTSDKRLKKDIENIDEKLYNLIEELELKQFKFKDRDNKIHFGIIAQDLIELSEKYDINILLDYGIITEIKQNEEILYTVNYIELLVLKNKVLENKYNSLLKRVEALEDNIKKG